MAWNDKYTSSIKGRRLGLQQLSSGQTGGSYGFNEFLVGPDGFRGLVSTSETTSANIKAHGLHLLSASSVGSSQVYTLDPPIPGISVTIVGSTSATAFIKTGVNILSTAGSTQQVVSLPAAGAMVTLTGVTSALWAVMQSTASGVGISAST